MIYTLLLCTVIGSIAVACTDENECSTLGRRELHCTIDTIVDEKAVSHKLDFLTITVAVIDSVILNQDTQVSIISLPLNYTSEQSVLVLHYDAESVETDTLFLTHTNTASFISMECGYEMKQALTSVKHTTHRLDSISVKDLNTNINGTQNLSLIYR
ncbi:calcium-binding protein P [Bacteroides sp. 214]|nr:calcium-binding protein P [Bacteroides sp. 214]